MPSLSQSPFSDRADSTRSNFSGGRKIISSWFLINNVRKVWLHLIGGVRYFNLKLGVALKITLNF